MKKLVGMVLFSLSLATLAVMMYTPESIFYS